MTIRRAVASLSAAVLIGLGWAWWTTDPAPAVSDCPPGWWLQDVQYADGRAWTACVPLPPNVSQDY